jgi:hypothetical protein
MPAGTVIAYTPTNQAELEVCYSLFFESYYSARKFAREEAVQASRMDHAYSIIGKQNGRVELAEGDLQATECPNNILATLLVESESRIPLDLLRQPNDAIAPKTLRNL